MTCDPLIMDGEVIGTITRGPEMIVDHDVPDGDPRWCFQCRARVPFRYQVLIAADPAARTAAPALLNALTTARDRADRAEAALQRVRGTLSEPDTRSDAHVRRALDDGSLTTPCNRGPCALGNGHAGDCRM